MMEPQTSPTTTPALPRGDDGLVDGWIAENDRQSLTIDPKAAAKEVLVALAEPLEFFTDERGDAYVRMPVGSHYETWGVHDRRFRSWLAREYRAVIRKIPAKSAVEDALGILEATARFDSPRLNLHNRFAWHQGSLWYDLADAEWRAVRIAVDGWEVVDRPPPLFRRYAHQRAQAIPERGGDLSELWSLVNIPESERVLVLAWLVAAILPDIPRAALVLWGPQGTTKSSAARTLRQLIDPSAVPFPTTKKGSDEISQALDQHAVMVFDNRDLIDGVMSDTLCRAVTGDGHQKRTLYTNTDSTIFAYRRALILNGRSVPAQAPDLLDRCVLVRLQRPTQRVEETELMERFELARPRLLGAVFDALARAMALYPDVQRINTRMADWARWGYAVAEALGIGGPEFLKAYRANRREQNTEALHSHPVGEAVTAFMKNRDRWEGTPSELLGELNTLAESLKIDTRHRLWPKDSNWVRRRLNEVDENLQHAGIALTQTTGGDRRITLYRATPAAVPATPTRAADVPPGPELAPENGSGGTAARAAFPQLNSDGEGRTDTAEPPADDPPPERPRCQTPGCKGFAGSDGKCIWCRERQAAGVAS